MPIYCRVFLLLLIIPLFYSPQRSSAEESLGEFGDWVAHRYIVENNAVCSLSSSPLKSEGKYARRGAVYLHVARREAQDWAYNISLTMGYPIKPEKEVVAQVGEQKFNFRPSDEHAFLPDDKTEAMLASMRRGNKLVVQGVSTRGTKTRDVFSLSGVTAGLQVMEKKCR